MANLRPDLLQRLTLQTKASKKTDGYHSHKEIKVNH
jgi:hypothetical protein